MSQPAAPIVDTRFGRIRGVRCGEVNEFRGIPYARPPVGGLRWCPPEAAVPWAGVLDAGDFGPDAMQRPTPGAWSRGQGFSEDCLRLNIAAPAGAEKLPVMLWFHGGSFLFGSAADRRMDPASFAGEGVVCVSAGFRLGIFGFLAHSGLVAESPHGSAGNYSLLDQIAALKWVRDNIEAFGGDPARITLFGVSSGGAAISLLLTSPLADGLFDRAILQSPGAFRPLAGLAEAAELGDTLGPLAALRELPAAEVLALEPGLIPAQRKLTAPRLLRPICDGWVIPLDERAAYESGRIRAVPTIVGSNSDEGSRLTAGWAVTGEAGWRQVMDENFGAQADMAARLYPLEADGGAAGAVARLFGDTQFQLGAREIAQAMARHEPRTFRYFFSKRRAGQPDGPHHGGEVPYVFGHLDMPPDGQAKTPPDARDELVSAAMRRAWLAFAATGDPGEVDGVRWPPAGEGGVLELGAQTALIDGVGDERLDFIHQFLASGGGK